MNRKLLAVATLALAVILATLFATHDLGGDERTVPLKLGVEFNTHATPVWIALNHGMFQKNQLNVTRVFKFRTGLELASALARGDVNIGFACLGPALMIIDKGIPVKIVAKYHNHGYALVVNSTLIKTISDLENATIYSPGKGSPAYLLLLKIADTYNIHYGQIRFMPPTEIFPALITGRIYAAALPEHYASLAEYKGFKALVRSQDIWPDMPGSFIVVRTDFLKDHPDIVEKIVEIAEKNIQFIKNNPGKAAEIDAEYLGIPWEVARHSIGELDWNTTVDYAEIQGYIDFMYSHGLLKHRLNTSDIVMEIKG